MTPELREAMEDIVRIYNSIGEAKRKYEYKAQYDAARQDLEHAQELCRQAVGKNDMHITH